MEDIRQKRPQPGLSRLRLAVEAGYSVTYLQNLEGGYRPQRSEVLPRVIAILEAREQGISPE
jgi:predicted transcriptional regulator